MSRTPAIPEIPKISAIIAAAGGSSRMNLDEGGSKQFLEIGGKPVICRTLEIFSASEYVSEIIISARGCDIGRLEELVFGMAGTGTETFDVFNKVKSITEGGGTRFESVAKAVRRASQSAEYIAVHDGARCFVTLGDIEKVALCAFNTGAAAAGCRVYDTVKRVDGENNITETLERGNLRAVQTPQIFRKDWYMQALGGADVNAPDDCYILESAGYTVSVVECSRYNLKITDEQDLEFLRRIT